MLNKSISQFHTYIHCLNKDGSKRCFKLLEVQQRLFILVITPNFKVFQQRHWLLCYPYIKVIGSQYKYKPLPEDLANRWTDMVLLYSVASHDQGKVYSFFGIEYYKFPEEITPRKKTLFEFLFLIGCTFIFITKGGRLPPTFTKYNIH